MLGGPIGIITLNYWLFQQFERVLGALLLEFGVLIILTGLLVSFSCEYEK